MTKEEFADLNEKYKEAFKRLSIKFGISKTMGTCESCKLSLAEKVNVIDNTVDKFKGKPQMMNKYFASLTTVSQNCCGGWFYLCIAVCAGSIEVFPVYLACCALCYHAECCSS